MKKEQYKELADKVVPHMETVLEAFKEYAIDSATLHADSEDGYFSIKFSDDNTRVEICRVDSGKDAELRISEKL